MRKEKVSGRDPLLVAFGLAIQKRRREMELSQEEAAARAGIHRTYFADVERGVRNVGIKNVVAIARGLDVTPSDLLKKIR
jgi:transcriptional regulator with XRE-family HTH domain